MKKNFPLLQAIDKILIPDRIRIIENLCKLVILEKEDASQKKLVREKKVYFKVY